MEKRGQGLSTTAIILIILGVTILVLLIVGFRAGWLKIKPYVSSSNVDTVVTQCSTACTSQGTYDYCSTGRDLSNGTAALKGVTCYYLSKEQAQYGIAACPAVSCSTVVINTTATTVGQLQASCTQNGKKMYSGKTVEALIKDALQTYTCP